MPSVDELCQSYLDLKYHFDPAAASQAGLVTHDARLGRFDVPDVRAHVAALRSVAGAVEELEVEDLQQEIDRTALLGELRSTIFRLEHERPHERNPIFWVNHLFQALYAVLARSPDESGPRAPAVLERLRAVPAFLDTARETLDEPPSVFVDSALAMLGGGGELIVQLAAMMSAETPGLADELRAAAAAALESLKRFGTALRDEIEPSADPHAFAIGEEQFARRLHFEHAVVSGAPELWRYGLHLQEETTAQLTALAAELGGRPWRELVEELRNDIPESDDLLAVYQAELDRARAFVAERDLVAIPEAPVDVVPTPPFLVALVPFAAYEPPPIYLGAPRGRFYVTVPDPSLPAEAAAQLRRGHGRHGIPAMVAHEAYPGHHLQLDAARRHPSLTRLLADAPEFVEGWGMYSELLMREQGFDDGPEFRVMLHTDAIWRACRIILDVRLHRGELTIDEGVDFLVEQTRFERDNARAEVEWYSYRPTYPLSYLLGRTLLLELRSDEERRLGAAFSLRDFHDALLRNGSLPISFHRRLLAGEGA